MQTFKTFLITFLSSVCIVFAGFGVLYWMITPSPQSAGTNQGSIPITKATSADNKTTLVFLQSETDSIFLLVKLNAVDCKVSATAIPSDYFIPHTGRTMMQSFEYAGIMQCVQDFSEHSDAVIDYHLILDADSFSLLDSSFAGEQSVADILSLDAKTIAEHTSQTIKNNITEIQTCTITSIAKNFSYLYTNIGKTEAAQLDRILTLLQRNSTSYSFDAINNQ